jgi:exosortase
MATKTQANAEGDASPSIAEEWAEFWRSLPRKGMFFVLLAAWLGLFHFLGNSTLGYVESASLFEWLHYVYSQSADDNHGYFIPLVVLGLMWWKRRELKSVPKRAWWPALILIAFGLALHVVGFMVQQTRVSVVGFFVGIYGLMGLTWGYAWLKSTFFPFFLFAFCVPLATLSEPITFPLRLLVTKITGFISEQGLGINVVCDGTRIFDPEGTFQYEVAAACSGIRSLTATLALALIFGFVLFGTWWKRAVIIASALPLAVAGNVFRLSMIIIAAEIWGQDAGTYVHDNSWLSLLPYVPALGGLFLLSHWLKEKDADDAPPAPGGLMAEAGQKA